MSNTTYTIFETHLFDSTEFRDEMLKIITEENHIIDIDYDSIPSVPWSDDMKTEHSIRLTGIKRTKKSCKNISNSKTLENHHLAKIYILTSPNGETIVVPKGTMNVVAKKLGLNPNGLRFNANTPRKDGTIRTLKGWVCQEQVC